MKSWSYLQVAICKPKHGSISSFVKAAEKKLFAGIPVGITLIYTIVMKNVPKHMSCTLVVQSGFLSWKSHKKKHCVGIVSFLLVELVETNPLIYNT